MTLRPPRSPLFPYTTLFRSKMGQDPRRLQSSILQMVSRRTTQRVIPLPRQTHPHMEKEQARDHMGRRTDRERSRSEEHTSELQSHSDLVCRLLLEKKKKRQE